MQFTFNFYCHNICCLFLVFISLTNFLFLFSLSFSFVLPFCLFICFYCPRICLRMIYQRCHDYLAMGHKLKLNQILMKRRQRQQLCQVDRYQHQAKGIIIAKWRQTIEKVRWNKINKSNAHNRRVNSLYNFPFFVQSGVSRSRY